MKEHIERKERGIQFSPAMFMPKIAARTWMLITSVRLERIQDISDDDILAESFESRPQLTEAWNLINAKRGYSWDFNPWVWAVSYKVISTTGRPER